jgi:CheY-like chemotaxis protein
MSRRVLVVDDDPDIKLLAATALSRVGGFDVRAVGNGKEAIDVASSWQPDAILMDVHMPGLDGPATADRLRAGDRTCAIPVVFITASVGAAEAAALSLLPVSGVLMKPFDPMTLPADFSALLEWT